MLPVGLNFRHIFTSAATNILNELCRETFSDWHIAPTRLDWSWNNPFEHDLLLQNCAIRWSDRNNPISPKPLAWVEIRLTELLPNHLFRSVLFSDRYISPTRPDQRWSKPLDHDLLLLQCAIHWPDRDTPQVRGTIRNSDENTSIYWVDSN